MATTTKQRRAHAACAVLVAAIAGVGHSQETRDASLEVTIRLLPENAARPDEITRRIELPPAAANPAAPPARPAEDAPAGDDNNNGRGREVAEEARERGRDFGQEVAEQARENRENAGRPDDRGPPEDRGRPDDKGPPATPPGQP
jgi:hypothetical protein